MDGITARDQGRDVVKTAWSLIVVDPRRFVCNPRENLNDRFVGEIMVQTDQVTGFVASEVKSRRGRATWFVLECNPSVLVEDKYSGGVEFQHCKIIVHAIGRR